MRYGIRWYKGVGEHDYEETLASEFASVGELLESLHAVAGTFATVDDLFDAFVSGRQDTIYWIYDDFGFELYRPS